jgi:hypothetical protein
MITCHSQAVIILSQHAPQAEVQPVERTADDARQGELSPRARAALSALVRLLARQTARDLTQGAEHGA